MEYVKTRKYLRKETIFDKIYFKNSDLKSFSGSIIEDKGAYESVRSFAHELGHNLGADHDGLSNSECSEWDNYIMASKFFPYNQLNSWRFSNCSIRRIKEYLLDFEK